MITKAFALYDMKAKFFGPPFFMQEIGLAVRAFSDLTNDRDTTVSRHPEDFSLYQVGTYDDSTGRMHPLEVHVLLGHGSDFKPTPEGRKLGVTAMESVVPVSESPAEQPVSAK